MGQTPNSVYGSWTSVEMFVEMEASLRPKSPGPTSIEKWLVLAGKYWLAKTYPPLPRVACIVNDWSTYTSQY